MPMLAMHIYILSTNKKKSLHKLATKDSVYADGLIIKTQQSKTFDKIMETLKTRYVGFCGYFLR